MFTIEFKAIILFLFVFSISILKSQDVNNNIIDINLVKVLKTLKVEGENAVHFREEPDENSPIMGAIENNDQINVIEELEDWFGISVFLQRNVMENGGFETKMNWEKVYVKKAHFAKQLNLKLKKEDLNKISMLAQKSETTYFNEIQTLDSLVQLEFVDFTQFSNQSKSKINYFLSDTNRFVKNNGELVIVCKKKKILFKDNNVLNESIQIYHYLGEIPDLNVFVIGCWYWEDYEYKLIDKKTGIELASLIEFPILSQDKQKLIAIQGNIYDLSGDLSLYICKDKRIDSKFAIKFSEWMPSYDLEDIFWGNDNCLYLAIINKNNYWKSDGNLNTDFQYVKIKFD